MPPMACSLDLLLLPSQFPSQSSIPSPSSSFFLPHGISFLSYSSPFLSLRWQRPRHFACIASNSSPPASVYAKEMERVAAKEALLLAIQDAGGGQSVLSPATASEAARIDVNERIVSLERLNPTPRPTTSPFLEGLWQFKWIGATSPGQFAARFLLQRFPSSVATLSDLSIFILDGTAKATASLKLFNMITNNVILTSKLTVEGPLRLKEEYVEGLLCIPSIQEGAVPMQIQSAYEQVASSLQRLPDNIKETLSNGIKIPLDGTFERQMLISYLDDEILIARDGSGIPEVLFHVSGSDTSDQKRVSEYVS